MNATGSELLGYLRTLAAGRTNDAATDRQLLQQFVTQREQAAFAALLLRYGPMVLGVCRRVLGHEQDAEDAFQATFLVLARKASSIRKQESLGSWLYGVAYRIAEGVRAKEARRLLHEQRTVSRPSIDPAEDVAWLEMRCVLDCELARLPESYRAPLVLCYLQGQTQDEAARQLQWPLRSFRRRLKCARELLGRRLTRRGITLSAALSAPLLIDAAAQAALPPLLAANTVRAGLAVAMGQESGTLVSIQAAALAEAGVRSLLTKKAILALVLSLSLMLGAGALLGHRIVPGGTFAESPAAPKSASPPTRSTNKDHAIEIKGRVLDPDGKPFAGARLTLTFDPRIKAKAVVRAKSDKDGRFLFTAKPADFNEIGKALLAVTADGFGSDWVEITTKKQDAVTLRLAKDDVPLEGRVLDLEGKPVANVTVRLLELQHGLDYYTKSIPVAALDAPMQATTGADGRFQLHGLGRERLAYLMIEGDTIERIRCWALTRDGKIVEPPKGLSKRGEPIYPATFDHIAAPTKPIIGTVRDKSTGKTLAGITVVMERFINSAVTDERGRYRITGNAKQREYGVNAVGRPYFVVRKQHIADTPGLEPLVVNFELERGIEITGRVFNKATGEPIQADIAYRALTDNPYLKKVSGLDYGEGNFVDDRTHGKADGTFFVIGLPGPGYLTALAARDDYHKPEWPADGKNVVPSVNTVPQLVHAWVSINPSKNDPKSMYCDIALEPAKPIPGQVLDADGKPLSGYFVAGLTGSPRILSNELYLHEKPSFQVRGFDVGRPRTLLFLHPKKKLGKIVVLRENPREPLQVRLKPLGAASGRVLDAEGKPRVGLQVRAEISNDDVNLWTTLQLFEWGLRHNRYDPLAKTDAEGRFHLDGLLPGLTYTLLAGEGEKKSDTRIVVRRKNVTVESGNTKDLDDLKIR